MAADRYQQLSSFPPGRFVAGRLGLPESTRLRRYEPGQPVLEAPALVGAAPGGRLAKAVRAVLHAVGAETYAALPQDDEHLRFGALVFDATGIASSEELGALRDFFHPTIARIERSGRLIVLGTPPERAQDARQAVAQRALEGFVRAAAKELRHGATGQLVYVAPEAEANLESTLRFLLSARSAYVSGQVIRIDAGPTAMPERWECPLEDKVALVTGASRGIGEAIADTLAREGALVVCLDLPALGENLAVVANRIEGSALALDITAPGAPQALAEHLLERHGGIDIVVHNAGITRDKTLARMDAERWDAVIDVNLSAPQRITEALLDGDVLRPDGRIVGVSSLSGVAGNRGQTNYATSKAGVIGLVDALAPVLAQHRQTINAVAPGFIETQMTAKMPLVTREGGRRMNSLAQGGLPVDVAETITWLASPGSGAVNGNVVRVCGQSMLGA